MYGLDVLIFLSRSDLFWTQVTFVAPVADLLVNEVTSGPPGGLQISNTSGLSLMSFKQMSDLDYVLYNRNIV